MEGYCSGGVTAHRAGSQHQRRDLQPGQCQRKTTERLHATYASDSENWTHAQAKITRSAARSAAKQCTALHGVVTLQRMLHAPHPTARPSFFSQQHRLQSGFQG